MKLVLITGGSRGIGASCAEIFSKNQYFVALNYNKSETSALALAKQLDNCEAFYADISKENDVKKLFHNVKEAFGKYPDILINNAGISISGLFTDSTTEDFDKLFDVNVKGAYLCCKEALYGMIPRQYGKIINISSVWGQTGASCEVLYSASKAALVGMTKALAKEIGPSGITVNCIAPGVIKTDMLSCYTGDELAALIQDTPLSRLGTPEDVAKAALFLANDSSDFITGQVLGVNGGFFI